MSLRPCRISAVLVLLTIGGCAAFQKPLPPVPVQVPSRQVDYLDEVKPILDKRCVVCHSCYNSPCQLKLSSFEGVDRGGTKKPVYNSSRLRTADPTRLFTDAMATKEWRGKGFFRVTESSASGGLNDSIMLQLLSHKMKNPGLEGDYFPEASDLTCAEDGKELAGYLKKHPSRGMPFGFPPPEAGRVRDRRRVAGPGGGGPRPGGAGGTRLARAERRRRAGKVGVFPERERSETCRGGPLPLRAPLPGAPEVRDRLQRVL